MAGLEWKCSRPRWSELVAVVVDAARHRTRCVEGPKVRWLLHAGWRAGISGQTPTANAWKAWKFCPKADCPDFCQAGAAHLHALMPYPSSYLVCQIISMYTWAMPEELMRVGSRERHECCSEVPHPWASFHTRKSSCMHLDRHGGRSRLHAIASSYACRCWPSCVLLIYSEHLSRTRISLPKP
jgi:hypothetical protein